MISEKPQGVSKPGEAKDELGFLRTMLVHDRSFLFALVAVAVAVLLLSGLFFEWIRAHASGDGDRVRLSGLSWIQLQLLKSRLGEPGSKSYLPDVEQWELRSNLDPWDPVGLRGYAVAILQSTNRQVWRAELVLPIMQRTLIHPELTEEDVRRVLKMGVGLGEEEEMLRQLGGVWDRLPPGVRDECLWMGADLGEWEWVGARLAQVKPAAELARWVSLGHRTLTATNVQSRVAFEELLKGSKGAGAGDLKLQQLLLQVAAIQTNAAVGLAAYERIKGVGADRLVDRTRWVVCRVASGDVGGATAEVERWDLDSMMGMDVRAWLKSMESVNKAEQAMSALEMASIRTGRQDWWLLLVEKLIVAKDWTGVRRVGTRFVGRNDRRAEWRAFGYALQAIAAEGFGSVEDLKDAEKMTGLAPVPTDRWTMKWAMMASRVGRLRWASPWLLKTQATFGEDIDYWRLRMQLAAAEGDTKAFLLAVRKAAALQPKDVQFRIEEAYALLVLHSDPELALTKLESEDAIELGGVSVHAGRALAMIQLGRKSAAESLIRSILPKVRTDAERAMLDLAQLQLARVKTRASESAEILRRIDPAQLPLIFLPELDEARTSIRLNNPGVEIKSSEPPR
jgi:hypothetical protein